jgi:hypothetical protein
LNQLFPGNAKGSTGYRIADCLFQKILRQCNYGVDVHTEEKGKRAAPYIMADLQNEECRRIAKAFGSRILFNHKGGSGSIQQACTDAGIPTILFRGGGISAFYEDIIEQGVSGILNILSSLNMVARNVQPPPFEIIVEHDEWVFAGKGGLLRLFVNPGDVIRTGESLAWIVNPFGMIVEELKAKYSGMVLGVTTNPLMHPGNKICHIMVLSDDELARMES